jgi:hypothetical protein
LVAAPAPTATLTTSAPTVLATTVAAVTSPAQPTPTLDVRKEAAAIGLQWNSQGFADALVNGDERGVKLFLAGGMKPTDPNKNSSIALYALRPTGHDPIPFLQMFIDNGFDPNTLLVDNGVMYDITRHFPDDFTSPDTPAVHSEDGSFKGPALLWLVMRAAYFGTSKNDVNAVNFLLDHGASDHVAKQYLEQVERIDGVNDDTTRLHDALYRTAT